MAYVGGFTKTEIKAEFTAVGGATAYSQYDAINTNPAALLVFANAGRTPGGSGYIVGSKVGVNSSTVTQKLRLRLYNAAPAAVTADNSRYDQKFTDRDKRPIPGHRDHTLACEGSGSDCAEGSDATTRTPYTCAAGDTNLYGELINEDSSTVTLPSNCTVWVILAVEQN